MSIAQAEKFLTHLQDGDALSAAGLLHEDAVWVQPGSTKVSGEHQGKAAVVTLLASFAQVGVSIELTEVYRCNDDVLSRIVVSHENGTRHEFQLIEMEGDLVRCVRHFGDTEYLTEIFA
uniref:nuclear transport factor 2 family protein n=1 Tax=uncultured Altererythrobacter sp. TaxID=500840 RepID=UPI0026273DA1|nr:nuclear transport factor 2 family protein [uncultured Altererythrobacter sp.]